MCEKSYQRFILYYTSLSINSKEFMQVLELKTVTAPWLQGNLNISMFEDKLKWNWLSAAAWQYKSLKSNKGT